MTVSLNGQFAETRVAEASLEATIIRANGRVEPLGVVAYYNRNPLKRLAWRIGRWLRGYSR